MEPNLSSVSPTDVSYGPNDIRQNDGLTQVEVNNFISPYSYNQNNNQFSNNQNYNNNLIKNYNKNKMYNKNQNIDNNVANNNYCKLANIDNNGNDNNNCNNYKYNDDEKINSNSNYNKKEMKKKNNQLHPNLEIIKSDNQNKNKNKENSEPFHHKVHKPDTNNLNYSSITSETDAIDKNEINTIKNIVEINYTTFERNRDKQISDKKTLSSLINSEIKKNLGGEWFVFVSKKDDKISFNLSTVSSTDFVTIEIGNSLFKIARTK